MKIRNPFLCRTTSQEDVDSWADMQWDLLPMMHKVTNYKISPHFPKNIISTVFYPILCYICLFIFAQLIIKREKKRSNAVKEP